MIQKGVSGFAAVGQYSSDGYGPLGVQQWQRQDLVRGTARGTPVELCVVVVPEGSGSGDAGRAVCSGPEGRSGAVNYSYYNRDITPLSECQMTFLNGLQNTLEAQITN